MLKCYFNKVALKSHFDMGILRCICCIFSEHFFYKNTYEGLLLFYLQKRGTLLNLFLYLLKTSENLRFFMFSGGIEREQCHETGQFQYRRTEQLTISRVLLFRDTSLSWYFSRGRDKHFYIESIHLLITYIDKNFWWISVYRQLSDINSDTVIQLKYFSKMRTEIILF